MDTAKLNDWLQVIGIFALVASLIFVGLQMRQTQAIALSDAYQSRAAASVEMITANAANDTALAAWYVTQADGVESLSPEEIRAGTQVALATRVLWDNIYYQYENGFISTESWESTRANLKNVMRRPFPRKTLESLLGEMRPTFRAVLIEIGKELDAEETR